MPSLDEQITRKRSELEFLVHYAASIAREIEGLKLIRKKRAATLRDLKRALASNAKAAGKPSKKRVTAKSKP